LAIGRATSWLLGAALAMLAACRGTTGIQSVPPSAPAAIGGGPARPEPDAVPTGTIVEASLDQGIGTVSSKIGDPFSARVLAPVKAASGRVIVPEGGEVRGFVVGLDNGFLPLIKIAFTTVDTVDGVAPIQATLISAERYAYVEQSPAGAPSSYDAILYEPVFQPGVRPGEGIGIGGGPPPPTATTTRTELRVPAGADLRLELSAPLVAPRRSP
jgi:hypothetical protein